MTEKRWLSALKPMASTPIQWQAFEEMLDYYIGIQYKSLDQAADPVEIYRAQGAVMAFRKLKNLRDEINVTK
jgi:hypothetical protein|tara:strand:- start:1120 stop:1335 length:216 start_codon:yes stop_codon:yes gene_type:complete